MLKKYIFNRQLVKKNKFAQHLLGYDKAKNIAILLHADEDENPKQTSEIIDSMKKDGKNVEVVLFSSSKSIPHYTFEYLTLTKADFSWYGKIINPRISRFSAKTWDLLYVINRNFCFEVDYLTLLCQAQCKLGSQRMEKKVFLDLMVSVTNQTQDSLFSQLHYYSKKIR